MLLFLKQCWPDCGAHQDSIVILILNTHVKVTKKGNDNFYKLVGILAVLDCTNLAKITFYRFVGAAIFYSNCSVTIENIEYKL
jgi:hypothetical protein